MSGFKSSGLGDFEDYFIHNVDYINKYAYGQVFMAGAGTDGLLGRTNQTHRSSPIQILAGGVTWNDVSTRDKFACAIKTDGTLWLWGNNLYGQLGQNNVTHRSSPVQVYGGGSWQSVSQGVFFTSAIKTDGTLWLWGSNAYGQLGQNNITNKSSPVQILGGGKWKSVSAGDFYVCAIKDDNSLWSWGYNLLYELGDGGGNYSKSSPVQVYGGTKDWKMISCGYHTTAAIKFDGTLWTWGQNYWGSLGSNTPVTYGFSPEEIYGGGTDWKSISSGLCMAAIKKNGTLWTWGYASLGGLGTNNLIDRSSPVQTVTGGTNWRHVFNRGYTVFAIKTDGTLWGWGDNSYGQLGVNDTVTRSSPIQVSSSTNWKSVGSGSMSAIFLQYIDFDQTL